MPSTIKSAPRPADETTEPAVIPEPLAPVIPEPEPTLPEPEAPTAPTQRYFRSVTGITDGATHYGTGDWFVGSEAILAHLDRTRGYDGKRLLYREISEQEYLELETARLAAITSDVEPEPPTYTPQVQENMVTQSESFDGQMA